MRWDPIQYARFADHRSRPFFELVARIGADDPARVVDLGCGSGELTITLAQRWPAARVLGIDSSPEMIERAPEQARVRFAVGAAQDFDASDIDVLVSNAMLQWVPGHMALLQRWSTQLPDGGWLAFQVPANFDAPSHRLMRELADSAAWREQLRGVLRHGDAVAPAADYLDRLSRASLEVDAWQTTYEQILHGPDPVLEWVRGTGLRPVLAALSAADAQRFSDQYAAVLREAYPPAPYGTVFEFARTFVVAHKPG